MRMTRCDVLMLFNEWVEGKPSLFNEISKIKTFTFITECGAENIDVLYKMKYGNRTVSKNVEKLTIPELARILVTQFGDNWENKYRLLKEDLLLGVDSKTVIDETIRDNTTRTSTSNQINSVSAFNVDDLSTNDSSENAANDDMQKESSKNTVTTHINMNAIKAQLELLKSNFIDSVLEDVSKIVSLSIY